MVAAAPPTKELNVLADVLTPVPPTPRIETPPLDAPERKDAIWYLAYGSNLAESTFIKRRKIKPFEKRNVFVPSLRLVFDLAGLPYVEPRFANSRLVEQDPQHTSPYDDTFFARTPEPWNHGLVGVAYLVSRADFAKILSTEGGGASYQDIVVECITLEDGDKFRVTGKIEAHTLCSPAVGSRTRPTTGHPSTRYMNLLRVGARENKLPQTYVTYLDNLPQYTRRGPWQLVGLCVYATIMAPIVLSTFGLSRLFRDRKTGRTPAPLIKVTQTVFGMGWVFYDGIKLIFGEGEAASSS